MRPHYIVEHEIFVNEVLTKNGLGHLIAHLENGRELREEIRMHEIGLNQNKLKLPKELKQIYDAYPSNKALFRSSNAGLSKRMYDRAKSVAESATDHEVALTPGAIRIPMGSDLFQSLQGVRAQTRARKHEEDKEMRAKHNRAKSERLGKTRKKYVAPPSGKEKR